MILFSTSASVNEKGERLQQYIIKVLLRKGAEFSLVAIHQITGAK